MPTSFADLGAKCRASTTVLRIGDDESIADADCPLGVVRAEDVDEAVALLETIVPELELRFGKQIRVMLVGHADFADYVQTVRARVILHADKVVNADCRRAYLHTLAENQLWRMLRDKRSKKRSGGVSTLNFHFTDNSADSVQFIVRDGREVTPDVLAEIKEDAARVEAALLKLNPYQARAVRMRYFGQMEPIDIAKVLGISNYAARSVICRGLRELRKHLGVNRIGNLCAADVVSISALVWNTPELDLRRTKDAIANFITAYGDIEIRKQGDRYVSVRPAIGRFSAITISVEA